MGDTASAILEAAMMLFAEKGFSAATTRQIAQRAGVNEVTLFRHFRSKTELFHKILEEIQRLYPPLMTAEQMAESCPAEIVREFCRATLRRMRKSPHLVRLLLYAMLDEVQEIRAEMIDKRLESYLGMLGDTFARLQRSGQCALEGEPQELARLLMSQVFGLGLMQLCGHHPFDQIDEERLAIQVSAQFLVPQVALPAAPLARPGG